MADASEIIALLNGFRNSYLQAGCADLLDEAIGLIELATKPLTLDECRDILNENEYNFEYWDEPWEVEGDHLYNGMDALTQFEAKALARAYEAQKEVGVG